MSEIPLYEEEPHPSSSGIGRTHATELEEPALRAIGSLAYPPVDSTKQAVAPDLHDRYQGEAEQDNRTRHRGLSLIEMSL